MRRLLFFDFHRNIEITDLGVLEYMVGPLCDSCALVKTHHSHQFVVLRLNPVVIEYASLLCLLL